MAAPRLELIGITVSFDSVLALSQVDLRLEEGAIAGLIGPNGAGKTTVLNVISGFVRPSAGRVVIAGTDVTRKSAHKRAALGLARSFQATRLFSGLSVMENVAAGALGIGARRGEAMARAEALLARTRLASRGKALAAELSGGDQRLVGVLRALVGRPSFLVLDEPAAGLDETESQELVKMIREVRADFRCGVLVIDHDMRVIMPLCEEITVLNYGRVLAVGDSASVRANPAVIEAYLGTGKMS